MVFTAGQTTAFFEHAEQMGIPHATVIQLVVEGINEVQDHAEFDQDALTQVADNLRRPRGRIPNPDPAAPAGATIAQPPFSLGAKAQKRLLAVCDLVRYYVRGSSSPDTGQHAMGTGDEEFHRVLEGSERPQGW
jgi:hypothetical protein